jgi:hypothetical protein
MVGSLQDLLSNHFFSSIQRAQKVQILDAYWKGISNTLPEVFQSPEDYALQKFTGVQVMHRVLISVLEYLRSKGKSLLDPTSYSEVLQQSLPTLEGDAVSQAELTSGAPARRAPPGVSAAMRDAAC